MSQLSNELKRIRRIVHENTSKSNIHMVQYDTIKRRTNNLNVKDMINKQVYVKFPQPPLGTSRKFYSKWTGPYKVISVKGKNVTVQSELNVDTVIDVHVERIKPFIGDDQNTSQP